MMCHASSVCIVIVMSFVGPNLQNPVTPSEEGWALQSAEGPSPDQDLCS